MSIIDVPVLYKQPAESRLYDMSFAASMASSETIVSVDLFSFTPSGLTVGSPASSGQVVQARISSGTSGVRYKLTCRVTTSLSNILECEGYLQVNDR